MRRHLTLPRTSIAGVASVIADPSRVEMLDVLLDGEAHSIGRLARRAGITAATASSHLRRLVEAGLVTTTRAGRENRVRLAGPAVAEVLEQLATLASPPSRVNGHTQLDRLRFARTCYDHLAGALGVLVATRLCDRGWLHRTSDNFEPAPQLFAWLAKHGHPVSPDHRRPLSRACLDWTEREPHVAGRIGAALVAVLRAERWVQNVRDSRALRLTERGRAGLLRELDVQLPGQVLPG